MTYRVIVSASFHYMYKDERHTYGKFETLEDAIDAAKEIVDDDLLRYYEPGITPDDLYGRYRMFSDDPWVSDETEAVFLTRDYVEARCEIMCSATRRQIQSE